MNRNTEIQDIKIESEWNIGDYVEKGKDYSWSDLLDIIYDLQIDYDFLQETFSEFTRDVENNYKRISVAEQIDISDKDFI